MVGLCIKKYKYDMRLHNKNVAKLENAVDEFSSIDIMFVLTTKRYVVQSLIPTCKKNG